MPRAYSCIKNLSQQPALHNLYKGAVKMPEKCMCSWGLLLWCLIEVLHSTIGGEKPNWWRTTAAKATLSLPSTRTSGAPPNQPSLTLLMHTSLNAMTNPQAVAVNSIAS